jgi:DNA-binding IscR family transcriptional regulator
MIGIIREPEGVSLIKPPELISITDILDLVRDGGQAGASVPIHPDDPLETLLRRRDEAVTQTLAGHTLRSLAIERMEVGRDTFSMSDASSPTHNPNAPGSHSSRQPVAIPLTDMSDTTHR